MNINVTFLIQIVNFLISYVVLSRFLLKPFILECYRQQRLKKGIANRLQKQEDDLHELITEKNRSLVDFRVAMKANYSVQPDDFDLDVSEALAPADAVNSRDVATLADRGAAVLAKKVMDGYRN